MSPPGAKGPMRGLSVRRANGSPGPASAPRAGSPSAKMSATEGRMARHPGRLTEFYDNYLDTYGEDQLSPPEDTRVAAWARGAQPGPGRMMSVRAPPSAYGGSMGMGGSLRRRVTKRSAYRRGMGGAASPFGDEDEYDGSDFDDAGFELVKIKVKVRSTFPPVWFELTDDTRVCPPVNNRSTTRMRCAGWP
jgi:hypothetical protein